MARLLLAYSFFGSRSKDLVKASPEYMAKADRLSFCLPCPKPTAHKMSLWECGERPQSSLSCASGEEGCAIRLLGCHRVFGFDLYLLSGAVVSLHIIVARIYRAFDPIIRTIHFTCFHYSASLYFNFLFSSYLLFTRRIDFISDAKLGK